MRNGPLSRSRCSPRATTSTVSSAASAGLSAATTGSSPRCRHLWRSSGKGTRSESSETRISSSFHAAGLPRNAKTSWIQTPYPRTHRASPGRRIRTRRLPGRARSPRLRSTTVRIAQPQSQSGTATAARTTQITGRCSPGVEIGARVPASLRIDVRASLPTSDRGGSLVPFRPKENRYERCRPRHVRGNHAVARRRAQHHLWHRRPRRSQHLQGRHQVRPR